MSGVVTFDPVAFKARYPQFANVDAGTLQMLFDEATLACNNTEQSLVRDLGERTILLNLIVAHLGTLSGIAADGEGSIATQVGRVSSASQGSVSASLEMAGQTANSAYWMQTQYGAQYWTFTGKYRRMRYVLPRRC